MAYTISSSSLVKVVKWILCVCRKIWTNHVKLVVTCVILFSISSNIVGLYFQLIMYLLGSLNTITFDYHGHLKGLKTITKGQRVIEMVRLWACKEKLEFEV